MSKVICSTFRYGLVEIGSCEKSIHKYIQLSTIRCTINMKWRVPTSKQVTMYNYGLLTTLAMLRCHALLTALCTLRHTEGIL